MGLALETAERRFPFGAIVQRSYGGFASLRSGFDSPWLHQFMEEVDRTLKELLENAVLINDRLLKGRSMKDVLLSDSMKEPLSSGLTFPMDFKYEKK